MTLKFLWLFNAVYKSSLYLFREWYEDLIQLWTKFLAVEMLKPLGL
jgi:hypothetical protein